jgi:hypothetical protein
MKMEAAGSFETSVTTYEIIRRHILIILPLHLSLPFQTLSLSLFLLRFFSLLVFRSVSFHSLFLLSVRSRYTDGLDGPCLIPGRVTIFFLHIVQNDSGTHPAFYPQGTGVGAFLGGKAVKVFKCSLSPYSLIGTCNCIMRSFTTSIVHQV